MPEVDPSLRALGNQALSRIAPSAIRAFDDEISQVPGIIKLTLGEPDFAVPEHVKRAAIRGIEADDSHYGPSKGKLALRQAISNYLADTRKVSYDPETEIIVTDGATEAVTASLLGLLNPGDKVLVPTPVFSLYFTNIEMAGGEVVMIDTSATGFNLTPERLEEEILAAGDRAKAVMLNYPCNPTGRTYSKEELTALAAVIKKHHLLAICDEIYSELTYDQEHFSLASLLPGQVILISGLSKSHAMTGYRLGYIAAPAELLPNVAKAHSFMVTCVDNIAQDAAIEALTNGLDDPKAFKEAYRRRRDFMVENLTKLGFEMAVPDGAFYIFAKIPEKFGSDDFAFAEDVAKKAGVGLIPGSVFGKGSAGYVRLSYAAADDKLSQVIDRLRDYVSKL
ncbi:aminotransferase [Lactobacillus nasalidis]|uniref:Aminotransferase n=1 Tax=Lactobacillus nasalidis TaxID=2797258 RepID=A0ABQ3W799_9LACO|nr:aminotransferase class I/II-fold pyridoxal phosphate-dependent enzyme [Lactobacillus nasalidis]GHV97185.1 aminotransferase [Lactobacillus nasalidis]GHV99387.1 aminotransferase [Lactobacillus nasalidis]GHW01963.1 aminotransferase [Lactobacillus nasalidis]